MSDAPLDPFLHEGRIDPLAEGDRLLDALGEVKRASTYADAFRALDALDATSLKAVGLAAMFERARKLDAEDGRRRKDERWLRRGRLYRTARFTWAALLHEWRRGR